MAIPPVRETDDRSSGRELLWIATLVGLQSALFLTRWTMGGNPVDTTLVAIVAAAILVGAAITVWRRPLDLTQVRGGSAIAGLAVLAAVVEVFAALVEPDYGWDEEFVLDAARAFASGGFGGLLERYQENLWLALRHPPLGPALFGLGIRVLGEGLLGLRLITVVFAVVTVVATASIARRLYGEEIARRAGWLLLSFPLFVRVGGVVMTDVVVTALFTITVALAIERAGGGGRNAGFWLGLLVSLCVLTKYTGALVVPVVLAIYAVHGALYARRAELAAALLVPGALGLGWLAIFSSTGVLWMQLEWIAFALTFSAQEGLIGPFSASETLLTKLPSAFGLYSVPLLAAGALALRRSDAKKAWLLTLWIVLVCVPLLLTLPDNRYFLPAFPAFAIVGSLGVTRIVHEPSRALCLTLALCLLTVLFYGLMPQAQPVFFFAPPEG